MRRAVLLIVLLLSAFATSQAQGPTWSAWLYNNATRSVWLVDELGQELTLFGLPVPDADYGTLSESLGVAHGGRYFAYFAQSATNFDYRFEIYDIVTRTMYSGVYQPPDSQQPGCAECGFQRHSLDIVGGHRVFSPDDRWLAIGFQSDNAWEIHVIDMSLERPAIAHTLRHSDPIVAGTGAALVDGFGLPVIQQVTDSRVSFTYLNSMEGAGRFDSYDWDFTLGQLSLTDRFPQLGADMLPATGAVLSPVMNLNFPNQLGALDGLPIHLNVLEAYYPTYGAFAHYNTQTADIRQGRFIQNGARLFIAEQDLATGQTFWILRDRNGFSMERRPRDWEYNSVAGVTNGFVITATDQGPGGALVLYDTTGFNMRPVGSIWTAPPGQFPIVVAVNPFVPANPDDFSVWAQQSPDGNLAPLQDFVAVTAAPANPGEAAAIPGGQPPTAAADVPDIVLVPPTATLELIDLGDPAALQPPIVTQSVAMPTIPGNINVPPITPTATLPVAMPTIPAELDVPPLPTREGNGSITIPIFSTPTPNFSLIPQLTPVPTLSLRSAHYTLLDEFFLPPGTLIPSGMSFGFDLPIAPYSIESIHFFVEPARLSQQRTDVSAPNYAFELQVSCSGDGVGDVAWNASMGPRSAPDMACGTAVFHAFHYNDNSLYINVVNSGPRAADYRVRALLLD